MRELMHEVQLKSSEAEVKVAVIVAADRLNPQAANAFLKTLEEPPPKSVLILLSTEPGRILETIMSRCLRLNFAGEGARKWDAALWNGWPGSANWRAGSRRVCWAIPADGRAGAAVGRDAERGWRKN